MKFRNEIQEALTSALYAPCIGDRLHTIHDHDDAKTISNSPNIAHVTISTAWIDLDKCRSPDKMITVVPFDKPPVNKLDP